MKRHSHVGVRLALVTGSWILLTAAGFLAGEARGQVVQLPVIHQFSVNTSVWVPDSGTTSLGGIDRGAESMRLLGPVVPGMPASRAFGREFSSTRAGVSATIIDLEEWDRAMLRTAAREHERPEMREAARVTSAVRDAARDGAPVGLAQLEQLKRDRATREQSEALDFVARARDFQQQGKLTTARYCYESALRRAHGPLRDQITTELAAIRTAIAQAKLAQEKK